MEYRKTKEQIDKIIDISQSILTIYNKFSDIEINKDYDNYKTYTEYLKIATAVEDNAYEELLNLCNEEEFDKIYYYHMENKNINNQDLIEERIENHIAYIFYGDKEVKKDKNRKKELDENSNKIIFAATNDFSYNLIEVLNNEINTIDQPYRDSLIKVKNEIIYSKKNIEFNILKNHRRITTEKESLITIGQNKKLVENTYYNFTVDNINKNINNLIYKYDGKSDNSDKIYLIFLHAHLKSLSKKEQTKLYKNFNNFINNNISNRFDIDGINKILELFSTVINDSNKIPTKKKTNNR